MTISELLPTAVEHQVLDESSKREVRRAILTAIAVPGYQVPFGSREMPVARGWGSGGLQVTLAVIGPRDVVKVYDQGEDGGVNAANLRRLIRRSEGVQTTTDARVATVIQTRHRVPRRSARGRTGPGLAGAGPRTVAGGRA